jgi:hypothetical protein
MLRGRHDLALEDAPTVTTGRPACLFIRGGLAPRVPLGDALDPSQVVQTAPNRVEIPPAPPYSTAPETDPPVVLEHDGTNWYVVQ